MIRTYSELILLPTFMERYEYLRLRGVVGESTFGYERYLNQMFYKSREWRRVRQKVIARDLGCDLGVEGYDILGHKIIIHHMNPITPYDIENRNPDILDLEFLISTSHMTHEAITFGDKHLLPQRPIIRTKNDTIPWR